MTSPGPFRNSLAPYISSAGIDALTSNSTVEDVGDALVRLREGLPLHLDEHSRAELRVDVRARLRAQGVLHSVEMIDLALSAPAPNSTEPDTPKKSQATRLVDLALAAGVELWHAPTGDPHITITSADHREHHRLSSRPVREWLARLHHAETGGAANMQAIASALAVLAGIARHDGAEHATSVRVAGHGGAVYHDLGDPTWRAVEITPAGWWLEPRPPVRMLRSRGMLPLRVPTSGGSIDALRELIHVTSDDDYRLLAGWLIGALRSFGPFPILSLVGEQGAGKSTAARVLRRLIDPHVAELRAEPRVIDDVMIAATRSRIVAIDNLSHLAPWLSDALCRLSTGGALTKRELYSDDDEIIIEAMRPVITTSITDVVTRGDLLDRAIVITLPTLPERERIPEAELWRRYETAAPAILGALLDGVVAALKDEDETTIAELPRMADWARWVTAAEPAIGWPGTSILTAYRAMRETAIEVTIDGDPLAAVIRQLPVPWEGTATDLLVRLAPVGRTPRGWPESARGLSGALRRLAPGLRRLGVEITYRREAETGRRLIRIDTRADRPDGSSRPSRPSRGRDPGPDIRDDDSAQPSRQPSRKSRHEYAGRDDGDGRDGQLQPHSDGAEHGDCYRV